MARRDITPPPGIYARNWGAAEEDIAIGVHRPLTLTCVTLQPTTTGKPLVLMGADLGWWKSHEDEQLIRRSVAEHLGIEMDSIMCCLSHTHSGPCIWSHNVDKPGGDLIVDYLHALADAASSAAEEALKEAVPATLTWAYGGCRLARNRDQYDPDQDRYLVGYNPDKPADQTLLVGQIWELGGKCLGTIVNYACHPTTLGWGNRLISPDYVGQMRCVVEAETHAPCVFLQGASGDLAPAEQYSADPGLADRHGALLGHSVLATLYGMLPPQKQLRYEGAVASGAPLGVWRTQDAPSNETIKSVRIDIPLPLAAFPTIATIERQLEASTDRVERERLTRLKGTVALYQNKDNIKVPVWIWLVGGAIFVGQPYESYSFFQRRLREAFPKHSVAVMNIVNGPGGYLPERELYDQQVYSVYNSPFKKGSLERLTACTIEQITTMLRASTHN